MSKYADVLKSAKDLLSKSYNYNNKVEVKTSAGGVTYTSEVVVSKPASATLKADFSVGKVKVDKLQIGTDNMVALETSLAEALPNTKVSFKATDGSRAAGAEAISAAFGAEYKFAKGTFTADVDALTGTTDATVLLSHEGFLIGAQAKATFKSGVAVADYNVLLGYKNKNTTAAVQTEKKLSAATAAIYQVVAPDLTVAGTAKLSLPGKPGDIDVAAGLAYKLDDATMVHAKATGKGKVALSYKQAISARTTLTVATELDAANVTSDDHKVGLNLAISA